MDDKKNKPRQEPKSSLQFADPADGGAGTAGGAITSGQVGPKSTKPHKQFWDQSVQPALSDENGYNGGDPKPAKKPHSKFSEYSEQAKPSERLQSGDIPVGDKKSARESRRMERSAFRSERTGAKLETATQKRNKKKPSKNPGVINSVRHAVQFEAYRQIHGKIYQTENENAGVEAAHRTELAGERVAGSTKRFIERRNRTRPDRRVRKWEKRDIKAKADLQFRKLTRDHPEFKKSVISRYMQKQRLKRRYQKQAREAAKKGAKAAKNTAVTTEKIIAAVGRFFVSHPVISLIAVLLIVIIVMLHSCTSMVGLLGSGLGGTVEGVADQAETVCTQFETELQFTIDNMETTHPGYDEYRYNTGAIEHNINEVMGFLMVYGGSPNDDIESVLRGIFYEQYTLTTTEITEERETENEDGETVTEEINILEITLTVKPFSEVIVSRLTPEQLERFNQYDYTQ